MQSYICYEQQKNVENFLTPMRTDTAGIGPAREATREAALQAEENNGIAYISLVPTEDEIFRRDNLFGTARYTAIINGLVGGESNFDRWKQLGVNNDRLMSYITNRMRVYSDDETVLSNIETFLRNNVTIIPELTLPPQEEYNQTTRPREPDGLTNEQRTRLVNLFGMNSSRFRVVIMNVGESNFSRWMSDNTNNRNYKNFVINQLQQSTNDDIVFTNVANYIYSNIPTISQNTTQPGTTQPGTTQPTGITQPAGTTKPSSKDENLISGISNVYLHIGIGVVVSIIILVIILMMLNKSKPSV